MNEVYSGAVETSVDVEPRYIISVAGYPEDSGDAFLMRCVFNDFDIERGFIAMHLSGALAKYMPGQFAVVDNRVEMYLVVDSIESEDGSVGISEEEIPSMNYQCLAFQSALEQICENDADVYQMIQLYAEDEDVGYA